MSTGTKVTDEYNKGKIKSLILLNEGNMGSNKASLDYFDYPSGHFVKNIFAELNPGVVKELGDAGNDIQIYQDKIYAVINCSNLIEVMDISSAKHISTISIKDCRYITFKDNYAYVASHYGPIDENSNKRLGYIVKVNTSTFKIEDNCTVGFQPEEMVICGNKLYVANSGEDTYPVYDKTVSVIDLNTFKVIKTIEVAINLQRMKIDNYGNIYVSSRGNYFDIPAKTYIIDTKTDTVTDELDLVCNDMAICGDSLYAYGTAWNNTTQSNTITYSIVNTKTKKIVSDKFITDGTNITFPYGIAINPETKEIFITDAKTFIIPGAINCFTKEGKLKWQAETGDIPAHIAFSEKRIIF
jgi:hypothetical protein